MSEEKEYENIPNETPLENNGSPEDEVTLNDEVLLENDVPLEFEMPVPPEPKLSFWQKFLYVFVNPTALFEELNLFPKILLPMLLIAVVGSLAIYINMGELVELQRQALVQAYTQQGVAIPSDGLMGMAKLAGWFTLATAGITFIIIAVVKALFTRGVASFFGGEGGYKRVLSVVLHSYYIVVIGGVIESVIGLIIGVPQFSISPALFLDPANNLTPFYILMASFNLFTLWYLAVTAIGVKIVEKVNWGAAVFCSVLPFLVFTFGQYFLSAR
ncbi:MAG: hypothetical protein PWQ12_1960 [Clostridiales bacterium]|jgi:hypothetical protein|nr:hypothetical protein [Clostridiales bacterium]